MVRLKLAQRRTRTINRAMAEIDGLPAAERCGASGIHGWPTYRQHPQPSASARWTQERLAEVADLASRYVQRLELPDANPRIAVLLSIADALSSRRTPRRTR